MKIAQLFAIHILTYVPILVHLSQYFWELKDFCNINFWILTVHFSFLQYSQTSSEKKLMTVMNLYGKTVYQQLLCQ